MNSSLVVQQLINGVMLGCMYALVAVGFTLYFGMLDLVNFAHGEIFMLGAFVALLVHGLLEAINVYTLSPLLGIAALILLTVVITSIIGVLMERLAIKPLRNSPLLMGLLATVGLSIIVREGVRLFYPRGASPQPFPEIISTEPFINIGGVVFRSNVLFILATTALLFIIMHLIIARTKVGAMIRATAQDQEAARMMGINVDYIVMITFILGSVLGAMAGILNGIYYHSTKFDIGLIMGVKGFAAAVVGGLGNVYGAIVGGFILGFGEMIGTLFIPGGAQYKDVLAFMVVILFLVFRPSGILGEKTYEKV